MITISPMLYPVLAFVAAVIVGRAGTLLREYVQGRTAQDELAFDTASAEAMAVAKQN